MPFAIHTLFLSLAVVATYFWTSSTQLNQYSLQLVGGIIIVYFALKLLFSEATKLLNALDAVIFTFLCFLLVISTGSLNSPVFFILYFLLFALSLLFEPSQSFLVALVISAILLIGQKGNLSGNSLINLGTLFLISPLAATLGRKYLESQEKAGHIKLLDEKIAKEETQTLIWLATKADPKLSSIIDLSSELIGSSALPFRFKEKLTLLHQSLIELHNSSQELESDIKEISKE